MLGGFLILCFTIIIVHHCKQSKKSDTKQVDDDQRQSEPQQPPLSQSQELQSTNDEVAEILKDAAKSIYRNSQSIKPKIFVECLTKILDDASSKLTTHRSDEELKAFVEFIRDMLQKSQSLIRLYTDGNLSKHCVSSPGHVGSVYIWAIQFAICNKNSNI